MYYVTEGYCFISPCSELIHTGKKNECIVAKKSAKDSNRQLVEGGL